MIYNLKPVRKQILGLSLSEATFKIRGFEEGHEAQDRLELVAKTVVQGYNTAIEHGLGKDLAAIITTVDQELKGFFFEGVAMGLYTLDIFSVSKKSKFWEFIQGIGSKHEYMSYIGSGLACAIFNRPFDKLLKKASTTGWLALDGIGFYYAMFKTKKALLDFYIPKEIKRDPFYLERYDNGVGRALWFYAAGEPEKIANTIDTFSPERRGAIWSGIGLAATYAGGVSFEKLEQLKVLSKEYVLQLGQGAVLAIHTRFTAGNENDYVNLASKALVGVEAKKTEKIAKKYKEELYDNKFVNGEPSFQIFLKRIRNWIATINKEEMISEVIS